MDEEGGGVCGRCCCRPPLGSSVGGGCEGDSCWEGEDGVSQAGGGGDRLLLCGLVEAGADDSVGGRVLAAAMFGRGGGEEVG